MKGGRCRIDGHRRFLCSTTETPDDDAKCPDLGRRSAAGLAAALGAPWWTLSVVATLAVGIAAVSVAYSAAEGILRHPLPFRDPERLVVIDLEDAANDLPSVEVSWNDFAAIQEGARSLAAASMMTATNFRFNLSHPRHAGPGRSGAGRLALLRGARRRSRAGPELRQE